MSLNEKSTGVAAGLTITRPAASIRTDSRRTELLPTIEDIDSVRSMTPTLTPTVTRGEDRESSPFSPFYSHPTTRTSLDAKNSESKTTIQPYDSDLEACLTDVHSKTNALSPSSTKKPAVRCSVWPGQEDWREAKRQEKRNRACRWNPMRNLDKRTKLWVKLLIALLIVGLAVGVGLGISKAVGGGIFKSNS